jgi:hypothetical protein
MTGPRGARNWPITCPASAEAGGVVREFRVRDQESAISLNLRASVRAIILDEDDHVLLCRFVFPHPAVPNGAQAVWTAPGGGIEPGEDGPLSTSPPSDGGSS